MVANSLYWTTADLDAMPDDGGWLRHEIIEGELFVTRAPHFSHQRVAGKIHMRLETWSEATQLGSSVQAPGLVFTPTDAVIPDVVWASQARLDRGIDEAGHFTIAPELVVEILSSGAQNEQRDKSIKLKLYSRYGVQEYWIVNWQLQTLEIYRRTDAQLQLVATLLAGDTLTSPLLPGFSAEIDRIFS
ncbi:Uma2 family endonuclease [Chamaesiphon sp. GL140_3_metabinner_50]|uniref:Uma2 family endonuclease n=1 Tax=Chamaesiphon sp. GL140_3_metabinner_50 TaxID=2970812 RepID=UPI0025D01762|nr:Uma2 family endonuclease [Chamaesiphon sp. GL140_3_metabinner_50]